MVEVLERFGFGLARVRYEGIGTTGFRNTETGKTYNYEVLDTAGTGAEVGPPAVKTEEKKWPFGTQTRYRDLESQSYITEEEYQRRKSSVYYRNIRIRGVFTTDERARSNNDEITVWQITTKPVPTLEMENWADRAEDIAVENGLNQFRTGTRERSEESHGSMASEDNRRIPEGNVRSIDRPIGRIHGRVRLDNGWEYRIDFSNRDLNSQGQWR